MKRYTNTVLDLQGNAVSGASITLYEVFTADSSEPVSAQMYSSDGFSSPVDNVTSNSLGLFYFYAENGRYDLSISYTDSNGDAISLTVEDVDIHDPTEVRIVYETASFTLDEDTHFGKLIYVDNGASNVTVTMPTGAVVAEGKFCTMVRLGTGSVTLQVASTDDFIESVDDAYVMLAQYAAASLFVREAGSGNTFSLSGALNTS